MRHHSTEVTYLEFIIKSMGDIKVTIIDREGESHELLGPTDMNMNIMELCKAYDLPVEGECGGNGTFSNLSMLS